VKQAPEISRKEEDDGQDSGVKLSKTVKKKDGLNWPPAVFPDHEYSKRRHRIKYFFHAASDTRRGSRHATVY
jgi:hypothetical protein